jgi:hypothetical protein
MHAQGMISDHETGSYHCCLLDLGELHGGRSYGSGARNAHQLVTTYASESGSFSSSCVFYALRKKPVPHLPQGGEDVVGLVSPPSNVGQTILREWSDRDGESQG